MSETTDKPEALPPCIFCNNESGSEEHIWPAWIHRYKKFGPLKMQEGTGPQVIADDSVSLRRQSIHEAFFRSYLIRFSGAVS
jgi:hypothetical protein